MSHIIRRLPSSHHRQQKDLVPFLKLRPAAAQKRDILSVHENANARKRTGTIEVRKIAGEFRSPFLDHEREQCADRGPRGHGKLNHPPAEDFLEADDRVNPDRDHVLPVYPVRRFQ